MRTLDVEMIVRILNQKFVENWDNPDKAEVLTEVLNDVKMYLLPTDNKEIH